MKKIWIIVLSVALGLILIGVGFGLGYGLRPKKEVPPVAPPSGTDVGNSDIDYDDFFGSEDEELPTTPETPNETPEDDKTPEEIEKPTEPELPDDSNKPVEPETPENDYTEFYTAAESEMEVFVSIFSQFGEFAFNKEKEGNIIKFIFKLNEIINEDTEMNIDMLMNDLITEWHTNIDLNVGHDLNYETNSLIITYTK